MNVYDYFIRCEKEMPEKRTLLRGTSFALRRAMVDTMEKLCRMQKQTPDELARVRDIGPKSLSVIDEVVRLFEQTETAGQSVSSNNCSLGFIALKESEEFDRA